MSVKSTQRINRFRAVEILQGEISTLSNDALGALMDALANTGQSKSCSRFDNFIVTDFTDDEKSARDRLFEMYGRVNACDWGEFFERATRSERETAAGLFLEAFGREP